jgi:hypothetical protein
MDFFAPSALNLLAASVMASCVTRDWQMELARSSIRCVTSVRQTSTRVYVEIVGLLDPSESLLMRIATEWHSSMVGINVQGVPNSNPDGRVHYVMSRSIATKNAREFAGELVTEKYVNSFVRTT